MKTADNAYIAPSADVIGDIHLNDQGNLESAAHYQKLAQKTLA